jgi:uncharacterized damage-inducible protein DinB
MSHTLRAHEIWLNRLNKNDTQLKEWETLELVNFENLNTALYNRTNEIIDSKNLDSNISYKNSKCDEFNNSLMDVLFHIVNHSNYHRGQINTEFKRLGIEPVLTDYILQTIKRTIYVALFLLLNTSKLLLRFVFFDQSNKPI